MPPADLFGHPLQIVPEHRGSELRLVLSGELDIRGAALLDQALSRTERSHGGDINLDLREVEFIDSTGLRTIIGAHLRLHAGGQRLTLVPGPERVQRLFALTRTAEHLRFVDDGEPPDNVRRLRERRRA